MDNYLENLSRKLYFLDKKERNNILKEYKNKIKNEIDNGKKISTILHELGSTDDIVKKICKEKNLDYDFCTNSSKFDKNITNISSTIANFIRDVIKVVQTTLYSSNLEGVLQVLIKLLVFALMCLILKLPFIIVESALFSFNRLIFYPFSSIFNTATSSILNIIYFVICIVWVINIFGNYRKKDKKEVNKEEIKNSVDKNYKCLDFIIKILIYLIVLIPLALIILFNIVLLFTSIFLVVKGIKLFGLIILFIGILFLNGLLFMMVKDSLYNKVRKYSLILSLSIVTILMGILFTAINISNFETPNSLENSYSKPITEEVTIELDDINSVVLVENGNYEIVEDDTLDDNTIKAQVTYYDDYVDVIYRQMPKKDVNTIIFETKKDEKTKYKVLLKNLLKDLQNGYLFDYSDSKKINVKIFVNYNMKKILEDNK